jgi:shikimate kinase
LIGEASSFGAISVVNAIATGKGVTVGIALRTRAKVRINGKGKGKGWVTSVNRRRIHSKLALETLKRAFSLVGERLESYSGEVETFNEAPVGVGLKSSSSSSVAITLAVLSAFGLKRFGPTEVLRCSTSASLAAGVSITGALDDAASCLLGGINFADNIGHRVLSSKRIGENLKVVIRVPDLPSRRRAVSPITIQKFASIAESLFNMSLKGEHWKAMTLNGLLYSSILGYDPASAFRAIELGAVAAGLSGTGPAVAAVFDGDEDPADLSEEWGIDGSSIIRTETNDAEAKIGF